MKFRKTPSNQRQKYTYYHEDGSKCVLEVGKATTISATGEVSVQICKDITEVLIKDLHLEDDRYVRANLKQINCEDKATREKRIENKKKWEIEHPFEDNPFDKPIRNIRFEPYNEYNNFDESKSQIEYEAVKYQESINKDIWEEEKIMLREYVATLPKSMQELFNLIYIEEYKQSEVAQLLNLSKSTVSERLKTLNNKIISHFKQKPELFQKNSD